MGEHRRLWSDTILVVAVGAVILVVSHRVYRHYVPIYHGKTAKEIVEKLRMSIVTQIYGQREICQKPFGVHVVGS